MNKKRIALALAAGLSLNALILTTAPIGGQAKIAHATQSRVTPGSEEEKKLNAIKIKSLETLVEVSTAGEAYVTFKNIDVKEIASVTASKVNHQVFGERTGLDTQVSTAGVTWENEKLKVTGITQPGIYSTEVTIKFNDGRADETYSLSIVKRPSDTVTYITEVTDSQIKISDIKLNNGAGDVSNFTATKVTATINGQVIEGINDANDYVFDLVGVGNLTAGTKVKVDITYGTNNIVSTSEILLVNQKTPEVTGAMAVAKTGAIDSALKTTIQGKFKGTVETGTLANGTSNYAITVGGKNLVTYEQSTYDDSGVKAAGADLTVAVNSNKDGFDINQVSTVTVASAVRGAVPYVELGYGASNNTKMLIGDYTLNVGGDTTTYFNAMSGVELKVHTDSTVTVSAGTPSTNIPAYTTKMPVTLTNNLKHGYTSVTATFGVDATEDLRAVTSVNASIVGTGTPAKVTQSSVTPVKTSVIVSADVLDGVSAQASFSKLDASKGQVTIKGGNKVLTDLGISQTDISLTVDGVKAGLISAQSTGDDLVFNVQFNGNIPSKVANWTLDLGTVGNLSGQVDLTNGAVETVNLIKVQATNNGTNGIVDKFRVEAIFGSIVPTTGTVEVDNVNSDVVSFKEFGTGNHSVIKNVTTGDYRGKYYAGVMVTSQPMTVQITKAESTTQGIANITVDATFFGAKDNENVKSAKVEYREKTDANNGSWSSIALTKEEIKEDAIVKSISNISPNKTYEFRAVYEYNNGTKVETITSNTVNVVISNNTSGNSGIVSGGSGSTTTGTSVGSTTVTVTSNNSTTSSGAISVTVPTSANVDTSKTPVPVKFSYKGTDGKTVTETKEQYSVVTSTFNGDKVELKGLVPGKEYTEISVDYTDKNGRTRTLILKDVKISATTDLQTYLANVYTAIFNRPADETGYNFHLNNLGNKKTSLREFLLNLLTDKEFGENYKTPGAKIDGLYAAIVARTPDQAGKDFWTAEYNKAVKTYGSEELALRAIADRMVNEPELKTLAEKMNVQW